MFQNIKYSFLKNLENIMKILENIHDRFICVSAEKVCFILCVSATAVTPTIAGRAVTSVVSSWSYYLNGCFSDYFSCAQF